MSLQISSLWTEQIGKLHERLASILTGRTSDSLLMTQISSVTKTVTHLLEEGQRTMSPSFSNLQVQYFQFVQLYLNALY
jgi:3-phenylpropionate/cinnamic acid dioxygenase small subunit